MARDRARVVLFADGNFLAHVSRVLEIGKVLRHECHRDVLFAATGRFTGLLEDAGFRVLPSFTVPRDQTLALARRAALVDPVWWYRVVRRSIESDIEIIRSTNPAVVVGDMHWSLRAAAVECGVPYVSVVNGAWTKYFNFALQPFDDHVLTETLGRSIAARVLPAFKHAALWYWALPYKAWRVRRGFDVPTATLADVLEGDATLVTDVPEFCPTRDAPDRVQHVGPILWNAPFEMPSWTHRLDRARPTVYVSVGSTGHTAVLDLAWQAFAGSGYQAIITTGGAAWSPPAPAANMFVTDFAPGRALLERADVCINHGGNGTIYQALSAGVPLVGFGGHVDQQIQLQLCEAAGVGRRIDSHGLTPSVLRAATDAVVEGAGYRQHAQRLQSAIARYDGPRLAARAVETVARGH